MVELIYYTGWDIEKIESMEFSYAVSLLSNLRKVEIQRIDQLMKGFAFYCLHSTRLAFGGSKNECDKYIKNLFKDEENNKSNDIEDQFKGEYFGE